MKLTRLSREEWIFVEINRDLLEVSPFRFEGFSAVEGEGIVCMSSEHLGQNKQSTKRVFSDLCWLLNSSVQSFGTYANLLTSSEWDTILPDLLLPQHWTEYI